MESWWKISVSSLVILAAVVFEISYGKTDRRTDKRRQKPNPRNNRRRG